MENGKLLNGVIEIVRQANAAVMEIYNSGDFDVEVKDDNSPLTRADKASNKIIEDGLKQLSNFPIISEEGNHQVDANEFWLVDPVDGTKEFIKRNGEFTVNVGLVYNGEPILGVVSIPATDTLYYGVKNSGAFKQVGDKEPQPIKAEYSGKIPAVAVSRSHLNEETEAYLNQLGEHKLIKSGSSIKFCLVAEGRAAIYPRLGPCMLWDTAAADAVLRAAGGQTINAETNQPLTYDPSQLRNPHFYALASSTRA